MSRWLLNVRGQQFSAANMEELRRFAKEGRLGPGDIVQPPGASEWLYAVEVPELKATLKVDPYAEYDTQGPTKEMSPVVKWGLAAGLALVAVVAWGYALNIANQEISPEDLELIGAKGLQYSEVLVTAEAAPIYASDSPSAQQLGQLTKNAKADLLAKRGDWYKLRANGVEGYARITDVIPAFFFADDATQQQYKPLYYPDQYVTVLNSSWTMTTDKGNDDVSVFNFMVGNSSGFGMTDIKLRATIKDQSGKTLEEREIPVEGILGGNSSAFVGMLKADPKDKANPEARVMFTTVYDELLKADPKLNTRWSDGVEIKLASQGFAGAEIRLLEVRAVPPESMPGGAAK